MAARDRSRSPLGGGAGAEDIMSLIFLREQARQANSFAEADQIRDRLVAMDVTLFDKSRQWRGGDGRSGKIPTWTDIEAGATPESWLAGGSQAATPFSMPAVAAGEEQIKHLVMQREQARAAKDFPQSDQLRDELKALGVEVFDKEKMWRGRDGSSGVVIGYRGSGGPTDIEINALIAQREKARQGNDFTTADMIRTELQERGVSVYDKEKTWKAADGRSGAVPMYNLAPSASPPFGGRVGGGGAVPASVQQQIMSLALQHSQDPSKAYQTLHQLQQIGASSAVHAMASSPPAAFGPGAAKPFRSVQARPVQSAQAGLAAFQPHGRAAKNPEVSKAVSFCAQSVNRGMTDDEILWLVDLRERTRQGKDFASADAVRDALKKCGIELWDKEMRWQTQDGRQGAIPAWTSLSGGL